ncbi:hypothetical protein DIPPA_25727 [Diplonema papillatum]|nr:hypothetical protein DIPPA_09250 [Diplonema papillatum]KAJ9448259.1 hypothetical protein DIPPA_25727 [Diplonema papillatum]
MPMQESEGDRAQLPDIILMPMAAAKHAAMGANAAHVPVGHKRNRAQAAPDASTQGSPAAPAAEERFEEAAALLAASLAAAKMLPASRQGHDPGPFPSRASVAPVTLARQSSSHRVGINDSRNSAAAGGRAVTADSTRISESSSPIESGFAGGDEHVRFQGSELHGGAFGGKDAMVPAHLLARKDERIRQLMTQLSEAEEIGRRETEEALRVTQNLLMQLKQREMLCTRLREQVAALEDERSDVSSRIATADAEKDRAVQAYHSLKSGVNAMIENLQRQLDADLQAREAERAAWRDQVDDLRRQLAALSSGAKNRAGKRDKGDGARDAHQPKAFAPFAPSFKAQPKAHHNPQHRTTDDLESILQQSNVNANNRADHISNAIDHTPDSPAELAGTTPAPSRDGLEACLPHSTNARVLPQRTQPPDLMPPSPPTRVAVPQATTRTSLGEAHPPDSTSQKPSTSVGQASRATPSPSPSVTEQTEGASRRVRVSEPAGVDVDRWTQPVSRSPPWRHLTEADESLDELESDAVMLSRIESHLLRFETAVAAAQDPAKQREAQMLKQVVAAKKLQLEALLRGSESDRSASFLSQPPDTQIDLDELTRDVSLRLRELGHRSR